MRKEIYCYIVKGTTINEFTLVEGPFRTLQIKTSDGRLIPLDTLNRPAPTQDGK